jgi:hypothetical protein
VANNLFDAPFRTVLEGGTTSPTPSDDIPPTQSGSAFSQERYGLLKDDPEVLESLLKLHSREPQQVGVPYYMEERPPTDGVPIEETASNLEKFLPGVEGFKTDTLQGAAGEVGVPKTAEWYESLHPTLQLFEPNLAITQDNFGFVWDEELPPQENFQESSESLSAAIEETQGTTVAMTGLRALDMSGRVVRTQMFGVPEVHTGNLAVDLLVNVATDPLFVAGVLKNSIVSGFFIGKALIDDLPFKSLIKELQVPLSKFKNAATEDLRFFGDERGFLRLMKGHPDAGEAIVIEKPRELLMGLIKHVAPFRHVVNMFKNEEPFIAVVGQNLRNFARTTGSDITQMDAQIEKVFEGLLPAERVAYGALREAQGNKLLTSTKYAKVQSGYNTLLESAKKQAEQFYKIDTSRWGIDPGKYVPHIFTGSYQVGEIVEGTFRTLDGGFGSLSDVLERSSSYLAGNPGADIVIKPRSMDFGIGRLDSETLEQLSKNPELAPKFTSIRSDLLKTPVARRKFYKMADDMYKEATIPKDEIVEILSGAVKISPTKQFFGNFSRRVSNVLGYLDDPQLALQIYMQRLIRKRGLDELVKPLYEELHRIRRPGLRSLVEDRIQMVDDISDPMSMPTWNAFASRFREIQGARKLWRPSSALVNWLGPYQLAYPELGPKAMIEASMALNKPLGKKLLKEIKVSGHRSATETGGQAATFREAIRGAKRDFRESEKLRGTTNLMTVGFRGVEGINRSKVPLAGYFRAKALKYSHEESIQLARDIDDYTNFLYNAADVPRFILKFPSLFQFETFRVNYAANWAELGYLAAKELVTEARIFGGAQLERGVSEFGVNNLHRFLRFMGAQTLLGGIRAMPSALRYGTVAGMLAFPFTTRSDRALLESGIENFIAEKPMARGIVALATDHLSRKYGDEYPMLQGTVDISTRVGIGGIQTQSTTVEDHLGVNFQDLRTIYEAFHGLMAGEDPGVVFEKSLRGDPMLKVALDVYRRLWVDEMPRDLYDGNAFTWEKNKLQWFLSAAGFPTVRDNIENDVRQVKSMREERNSTYKKNQMGKVWGIIASQFTKDGGFTPPSDEQNKRMVEIITEANRYLISQNHPEITTKQLNDFIKLQQLDPTQRAFARASKREIKSLRELYIGLGENPKRVDRIIADKLYREHGVPQQERPFGRVDAP